MPQNLRLRPELFFRLLGSRDREHTRGRFGGYRSPGGCRGTMPGGWGGGFFRPGQRGSATSDDHVRIRVRRAREVGGEVISGMQANAATGCAEPPRAILRAPGRSEPPLEDCGHRSNRGAHDSGARARVTTHHSRPIQRARERGHRASADPTPAPATPHPALSRVVCDQRTGARPSERSPGTQPQVLRHPPDSLRA